MTKIDLKSILTLVLLILACNITYGQDSECTQDIRKGKFVNVTKDGVETDYIVKRTKNKQIEILSGGKIKIISKIEWLDDTHYTLTTIKIISEDSGCDSIGAICYVAISSCIDGVQTCNWRQDGCGDGVMWLKKVK